jgi:hypothetical protein
MMRYMYMAFEDARMMTVVSEWMVEVTQTVMKYVNAGSEEEAKALALEDDDYVRLMQKQVTHAELITK